jgi:predicted HTH domain antitoxin
MPLLLTDEQLAQAGLTEADVKLELACRLFAAGKIPFPTASKLAGVTRTELENALIERDLPIVRLTLEGVQSDLDDFEKRWCR